MVTNLNRRAVLVSGVAALAVASVSSAMAAAVSAAGPSGVRFGIGEGSRSFGVPVMTDTLEPECDY